MDIYFRSKDFTEFMDIQFCEYIRVEEIMQVSLASEKDAN